MQMHRSYFSLVALALLTLLATPTEARPRKTIILNAGFVEALNDFKIDLDGSPDAVDGTFHSEGGLFDLGYQSKGRFGIRTRFQYTVGKIKQTNGVSAGTAKYLTFSLLPSIRFFKEPALEKWDPYVIFGTGLTFLSGMKINFTRPDGTFTNQENGALIEVQLGAGLDYFFNEDWSLTGEFSMRPYFDFTSVIGTALIQSTTAGKLKGGIGSGVFYNFLLGASYHFW